MITILKLASVSAVLSAGVVTAIDTPKPVAPVSGKLYQDRIVADVTPATYADASKIVGTTASDAQPASITTDCRAQAWPYKSQDCVVGQEGSTARRVVRTITIERRDSPNTSTLVRLPAGQAVVTR